MWVCMHVSNIKGKHRFFGVCVVREVTVLVAAVYWDHVCHMMCRVLLSCCGQPGDTSGCLSWEELKASTPCCSAEQSIIVCTWQVFSNIKSERALENGNVFYFDLGRLRWSAMQHLMQFRDEWAVILLTINPNANEKWSQLCIFFFQFNLFFLILT